MQTSVIVVPIRFNPLTFVFFSLGMLERVPSAGLGSMPGTYGGQRGVAIIDDEPERHSGGCCSSS